MKIILFILLALLTSCGDSNRDTPPPIGQSGSLHEGIESLMMHELSTIDNRLQQSEVQPTSVDSIPDTTKGNTKVQYDLKSSSNLNPNYSMFDAYPNKTYSARTYKRFPLKSRNNCLDECIDDTSCGSVTYIPTLGICKIHGPNVPWYTFGQEPISSTIGLTSADTYVYRDRKADTGPESRFGIEGSFGEHGLSSGSTIYLKFLYGDKTASNWIPYQYFSYNPDKFGGFGSEQPYYFKYAEAFVFATNSKKLASIQTIRGYMSSNEIDALGYDQDYLDKNIFSLWSTFMPEGSYDGITINPNCDGGTSDSCTDVIIMPTHRDTQESTDIWGKDKPYSVIKNNREKFGY
jgi:hypothetical protein